MWYIRSMWLWFIGLIPIRLSLYHVILFLFLFSKDIKRICLKMKQIYKPWLLYREDRLGLKGHGKQKRIYRIRVIFPLICSIFQGGGSGQFMIFKTIYFIIKYTDTLHMETASPLWSPFALFLAVCFRHTPLTLYCKQRLCHWLLRPFWKKSGK